jgi:hypothetical protein
LIGASLAEQNDVWQERCDLGIDKFAEWVAAQTAGCAGSHVAVVAG